MGKGRSRRELPAGAFVCRCSQGQRCRAGLGAPLLLTPEGSARTGNPGRKSYCHCTQPQALSISLYATNCSSEPELFRADSSDSSLEHGDTGTGGGCGSPAQAHPSSRGSAGQLAPFVKWAGGSQVEHTVLGTSPSPHNRGCWDELHPCPGRGQTPGWTGLVICGVMHW